MIPNLSLDPSIRSSVPQSSQRSLTRCVVRAARRLSIPATALPTIGLRLVGDLQMAKLHARHMEGEYATDVLSFPVHERPDPEAMSQTGVGDLVINWHAVIRQAADPSPAAALAEACSLAVHGLVHLVGHDHRTRGQARRMLRLEVRACRAAGLPPPQRPYAR